MFCEALFSSLCIQRGNVVLGHVGGMELGEAGRYVSMQLIVEVGKAWALCQGEVEPIGRKGYVSKTSKTIKLTVWDSKWLYHKESKHPFFFPSGATFLFSPTCLQQFEFRLRGLSALSSVHLRCAPGTGTHRGSCANSPNGQALCWGHPPPPSLHPSVCLPLTSLHTTLLQADLCWQGYPTCKLS